MKPQANVNYKIEMPTGTAQVMRIQSIFANNGNQKNHEHLLWQYKNVPCGGAISAFAVTSFGIDAAVYSVFTVKAKVAGKLIPICQSLDTMTDKDHRGKGLFPILAKEVYQRCEDDGVAFVYGFPNSNSGPGFFNKLDWRELGHPPFLFYLNNLLFPLAYFFKRRIFFKNYFSLLRLRYRNYISTKTGIVVSAGADFSVEKYNALWGKFSDRLKVAVWRDSEYMKWRYEKKPGKDYSFFSVYKNGALAGIVVYCWADKHNGRVGYIMDLIYDPDIAEAPNVLMSAAVMALTEIGVDLILAWSAPPYLGYLPYRRAGFYPMPRSLQPIKLFFGVRGFGSSFPSNLCLADFYISYADSDTV